MDSIHVDRLLPDDLPDWRGLVERGRDRAAGIEIPATLFRERYDVRTEEEFRRRMAREDRIIGEIHIGLNTWRETADALLYLQRESERRGLTIHSYHLITDRRMGLPPEMRARAPQETGPMLESDRDWYEVGHTVPMEPQLNDFMIGSPASVVNVVSALRNGITKIGNVSQFFWRYPYYDDEVAQMAATVEAIAIMAAKRDEGAVVLSYLDDGYPGIFHDYASIVGWAKLERYIVEELLGAQLSVDFGGLTYDPPTKAAVCLALDRVNARGSISTFHHGNTIEYQRQEITRNYAVLALDMAFMAATEKMLNRRGRCGSGLLPIPVTEALRIPTPEEIMEAFTIMCRAARDADRIIDYIDWPRIDAQADRLVEGGERFFRQALAGLAEMGVDTSDPLAILMAVKRLGAARTEQLFGPGEPDPAAPRGLRPVIPTDMIRQTMSHRARLVDEVSKGREDRLAGVTVVAGSTDIHEYGLGLVRDVLQALGAKVVDAGLSADPEDLAKVALETDAVALAISTHNGMALSYAKKLLLEMEKTGVRTRVIMGGTLNEPVEDSFMPADVRDELRGLGVIPCDDIPPMVEALEKLRKKPAG